MYGGVLDFVLSRKFRLKDCRTEGSPFCSLYSEKTFEILLVKWSLSIMAEALSQTHNLLLEYSIIDRDAVEMQGGDAAKRPATGLQPDWAGTLKSALPILGKNDLPTNILPGETKLSSKWSCKDIVTGPVVGSFKKIDWLRPLTQLNTYCINANARFGYIITDKELVAIRIRVGPQSSPNETLCARARKTGIMEFKVVPWLDSITLAKTDYHTITINLALWWLHMMAAEGRGIEEHYPPLRNILWSAIPEKNQYSRLYPKHLNGKPDLHVFLELMSKERVSEIRRKMIESGRLTEDDYSELDCQRKRKRR